jgi:hypothetical protein
MNKLELEALLEAYQEWMKEELPTLSQHCRHMIYGVETMLQDCLALVDNPFLKRVAARHPGEYGVFNPPALKSVVPPAPLPLFSQEVPTGGVVEEEYLPTPDVVTEK